MSLCNCHNCKPNCCGMQLVHYLGRNCLYAVGCNGRIAMQALSGALRLIGVWVAPKGAVCVLLNPPPSVQTTPTCVHLTETLTCCTGGAIQQTQRAARWVLSKSLCRGFCATCLCCFHTLLTMKVALFLDSSHPGPGKAEVPALQLDAGSTRQHVRCLTHTVPSPGATHAACYSPARLSNAFMFAGLWSRQCRRWWRCCSLGP
jgi:hypothetical protein